MVLVVVAIASCNGAFGVDGLSFTSSASTTASTSSSTSTSTSTSATAGVGGATNSSISAASTAAGIVMAQGGSGGTAPVVITIKPLGGLQGDGFLAHPNLCGQEVFDSYAHDSYKGIHVGRDPPCNQTATYRAFVRFKLDVLGSGPIVSAKLRLYLKEKTEPTAGVDLQRINDFGNLDANDWNKATIKNLGGLITPGTKLGWIEADVTPGVSLALADGVVAYRLIYDNEAEDPGGKSRWYVIVASDNGTLGPELVVTK
jgi:hypothetical protein